MMSRSRLVWLVLGGLVAMIVAGVFAGRTIVRWQAARVMAERARRLTAGEITGIRAGMMFPDLKVLSPEGGITGTRALISGASTLIVFMVPGCESCTDTLKAWSDRRAGLSADVRLVAISESGPEILADYSARNGIDIPIYCDATESFAERYEMTVLPTLVAVDAGGAVTFVRHGLGGDFSLEAAATALRNASR